MPTATREQRRPKAVEPRVKGISFRATLSGLRTLRGDSAVEATFGELARPLADALRFGQIVSGGWYTLEAYRDLHAAMLRATRSGPELARAIGIEQSRSDFRGVYRLLTFVLAPERLLTYAPRAWSVYFDGGVCQIVESRDGMARARYSGCAGFDRNVWQHVIGGSEGLLEVCGAEHVRMRIVAGGRDGDDHLDLEARWLR